jgi:3-ketosteroid 9alpha-monooxygenase subunit A
MSKAPQKRSSAYPRGWFFVGYSSDLAPGEVGPIRYFDQELVLFRAEEGAPHVFDAFCAHLGAHLGFGGRVQNGCIRCPFHAWEYDESGRCVHIPYAEKIPKGASVNAWPTEERSGLILVWHDPAKAPPAWSPPELTEFGEVGWTDYQRYQITVQTSIDEVVENIFDLAHGQFVHQNDNGNSVPTVGYDFDDHSATVTFENDLALLGGKTHHVTTLNELGINVNRATGVGSKSFVVSYTPVDPSTLDVHFSFVTPEALPDDPTGEISRRSAATTVELFYQDIPIWEHKMFRANPLLCAGDGPIGRYRKWARQFYDDSEPDAAGHPVSSGSTA